MTVAGTVGIVGGGQLARMLALAGVPLGLRFVFLDPAPDPCCAALGEHLAAPYEELDGLAGRAGVVTYEFENVPDASIRDLATKIPVFPDATALAVSRDRLAEKTLFNELGIQTPRFSPVESPEDLERGVAEIGLPAVLKARTLGYDGKHQVVLHTPDDVAVARARCDGAPMILEEFVPFDRELSVLAVRSRSKEVRFYPTAENIHREGILRVSRARPGDRLESQAQDYARRLLDHLDYTGVMALELFEVDGVLLANEMAPRVHNSGHWTIEGSETSQFENHLRAILGLPLGSTRPLGYSAMVNLIGEVPEPRTILAVEGAHLHVYGKASSPGRKLGHVTVRARTQDELEQRLARVLQAVS